MGFMVADKKSHICQIRTEAFITQKLILKLHLGSKLAQYMKMYIQIF